MLQVTLDWRLGAGPPHGARGTLTVKEFYSDFSDEIEFADVWVVCGVNCTAQLPGHVH